MPTAQEFLAQGDPQAALAALQQQVRAHAADPKLRVFLFQLLCVLGQWQRALDQLQVCGELDAGTLAMVNTYRPALQCEAVREAVFDGKVLPHVFGQPQAWVALLAQALQADAQGDPHTAARLRESAFEQAPASAGMLDDRRFEWLADADPRLGPICECFIDGKYYWVPYERITRITLPEPSDVLDAVWASAEIEFSSGGTKHVLIPVRYPGTESQEDDDLRLSRKTVWQGSDEAGWTGLGQRVLSTDQTELGLMDVRELSFDA